MTYYLMLPHDTEDTALEIGESSFNTFWAAEGLAALTNISNNKPSLLPDIIVIKQTGQKLTPEQFLSEISSLNVISN